ncbi:nuclear transport factor 2 family protein [Mycolicibacterium hippocampi]|uniref:SnoaL-like domain-containing protein n=1 Tax=Mycolicibacterium hippocampi TaxID=659824 RepID=A0A7I9ZST2_9MYCO|nr:nuclear transport factor 2 family protein [Mycolicibacterium hippocampi]GFH04100.1 hypothetical protein MHIP_45830 [Mycolicibacterium hippocampi]
MASAPIDHAVVDVVNEYPACLDTRDWADLDGVFTPDVVGRCGSLIERRHARVASIRSFLDNYGPPPQCFTKARVMHIGQGARAALVPYEAIEVYRDQFVRTPKGWRIKHRHF